MRAPPTFDPIWQRIYEAGSQLNRYPFDSVVSFVYRHRPRDKEPPETDVVEVGFGAGANLWFAAREGFRVAGVEASPTAVAYAEERFRTEGLIGDLRVGDFTDLPFDDDSFDLGFDRGSLTCVARSDARRAVEEIARVLRPGGRFLLNVYSDEDSSVEWGRREEDGFTVDIDRGPLAGVGPLAFYDRAGVDALLAGVFAPIDVLHLRLSDEGGETQGVHAEWRVVAERHTPGG